MRLLASTNYIRGESPENSVGAELGFLDTVFGRVGYYDDRDGHVTGFTYGAGINLHYSDFIALETNYANFMGGELVDRQSSWDFMVKYDLLQLVKLF